MIDVLSKMAQTLRNLFDPEPLPVAKHAEWLSTSVCARASDYIREHEALAAAIRESRAERYVPRYRPRVVR